RVALETESATSAAQASLAAAGEGTVAAKETLRRLEEIQESLRQAERSYLSLEVQLSEVGQFVDTIEGISRQTNLLSVNAGIIAAQAGEEGRGFAVVADEIRALSGKTSDSTEQIFQLVSRIEEESKTTLAALRVGLDRVSVGIEVGVTAVAAFERIRDSARELDLKIRDVYETSRKSTQTAEAVRLALADVSDVAVELGRSAKQHVNNGEMVRNLAQKTSEITVGVLALVDTQSRESRQVADALEEIAGMSHDLKRDQREQGEQAQAVVDTVMLMQRASAAQGRAVSSLEAVVREVESQASALHRLLSTFRV
ncbi:MAG: methyl-accepting chemotaxis protein, partial [Myxococcota bacterium]